VKEGHKRKANKRGEKGDRCIEISEQGRNVRPDQRDTRQDADDGEIDLPEAVVAPIAIVDTNHE